MNNVLFSAVIDRTATKRFKASNTQSKYLSLPALPPVGTVLKLAGVGTSLKVAEIAYSDDYGRKDTFGFFVHLEASDDIEGQLLPEWTRGSKSPLSEQVTTPPTHTGYRR